jgi:hypothetical protein
MSFFSVFENEGKEQGPPPVPSQSEQKKQQEMMSRGPQSTPNPSSSDSYIASGLPKRFQNPTFGKRDASNQAALPNGIGLDDLIEAIQTSLVEGFLIYLLMKN